MGKREDPLKEQTGLAKSMWEKLTSAAEQYNAPGQFTALIGYEWTSDPNGNNLHRNVIFRDGKDKADQIVPFSQYDSVDPEDLWSWMAAYEDKTGGRLLAIPHNGNLSNGLMFDDVTLTTGKPLDRDYAERRARWEPLYEVTQMKGDGEAHPFLSAEDEFADFETWDKASFGPEPKTPDMLPREYAREAYKRGLAYEAKLGANPFKFGMIGSTDSHTSLSTAQEDNFFGKVVLLEPSADPIRFEEVIAGRPAPPGSQIYARETSASGLAAVWARENTREALWDAMARKEVYATTGTRIRVRVFGGFDFGPDDLQRSDFAAHAYRNGVPMGGDMTSAPEGKAAGLPGAGPARPGRRQSGPHPDRQGLARRRRQSSGAHLRHRRLGRPNHRRGRPLQGAGRQHGERRPGHLHQRHRRRGARRLLARPGLRPRPARLLLRAGAGDPDAALDHL